MADERKHSDIPYHNAETERIQAERQAELEAEKDGAENDGEAHE